MKKICTTIFATLVCLISFAAIVPKQDINETKKLKSIIKTQPIEIEQVWGCVTQTSTLWDGATGTISVGMCTVCHEVDSWANVLALNCATAIARAMQLMQPE